MGLSNWWKKMLSDKKCRSSTNLFYLVRLILGEDVDKFDLVPPNFVRCGPENDLQLDAFIAENQRLRPFFYGLTQNTKICVKNPYKNPIVNVFNIISKSPFASHVAWLASLSFPWSLNLFSRLRLFMSFLVSIDFILLYFQPDLHDSPLAKFLLLSPVFHYFFLFSV